MVQQSGGKLGTKRFVLARRRSLAELNGLEVGEGLVYGAMPTPPVSSAGGFSCSVS